MKSHCALAETIKGIGLVVALVTIVSPFFFMEANIFSICIGVISGVITFIMFFAFAVTVDAAWVYLKHHDETKSND